MQNWMRRWWACYAFALVGMTAMAGCSTVPIYNETRDKQAKELKKSVGEVDIEASVTQVEQRLEALRKLEDETFNARRAANLEFEIGQLAASGVTSSATLEIAYIEPMRSRFSHLIGRTITAVDLDVLVKSMADSPSDDSQVKTQLRSLSGNSGIAFASCKDLFDKNWESGPKLELAKRNAPVIRKSAVESIFTSVLARCKPPTDYIMTWTKSPSVLQDATDRYELAAKNVKAYEAELKQASDVLAGLVKEYDKAVNDAKATPADSTYKARIEKAADKLGSDIQSLLDKDGRISVLHAEAKLKLESLGELVEAVHTGKLDPEKLSPGEIKSVTLIQNIASLTDETDALLKAAKAPRQGPLLLAKEQQQLIVDAYAAKGKLLERRADIRKAQVFAIQSEVMALAKAQRVLAPPPSSASATVDASQTLAALMKDGGATVAQRQALFLSYGFYFDEAHEAREQYAVLDQEWLAIADEIIATESRQAARMWQKLLQNTAAILADYHASGIKPATLAELFKGLGIFYIGHQVGK